MAAKENDATENEAAASKSGAEKTAEVRIEEGAPEASGGERPDDALGDGSITDPQITADDSTADDPTVAGYPEPDVDEPAEVVPSERRVEEPAEQPGAYGTVPEDDGAALRRPELDPEPASRAVESEDHHHEQEEAEGTSFAARVLTLLIVLIIGAALGIWGAPKLAPLLPSGMEPVAQWLTPATNENDEEIAALAARVDDLSSKLDGISTESASSGDVDAAVQSAVSDLRGTLSPDIEALKNQVAEIGGSDTAQQIASLQSAMDGQTSELASIKDQLNQAGAAAGATSANIDVYQAELEGVRGEVRTLTDSVASLGHRIDEVAATADRSISAAEQKVAEIQDQADKAMDSAAIDADVSIISAALASGQPFQDPADRLDAAENVDLPEGLATVAGTGVPTLQALKDDFPEAAHAAIRASIKAQGDGGFLQRSRAFLEAQLATRSLSPQEGEGTDAVLSRMEGRLRENDLSGALAEADQLPGEAAEAMSGWLDSARKREAADAGLSALQASLSPTN
jgi:hypothetical protein